MASTDKYDPAADIEPCLNISANHVLYESLPANGLSPLNDECMVPESCSLSNATIAYDCSHMPLYFPLCA